MIKKLLRIFKPNDTFNQNIKSIDKFLEDNHLSRESHLINDCDSFWIKSYPPFKEYEINILYSPRVLDSDEILITIHKDGIMRYKTTTTIFDDLVLYDLILQMLKLRTLNHLKCENYDFKDLTYIFNYFWFDKNFRLFNTFVSDDGDICLTVYNNDIAYEVSLYADKTISLFIEKYKDGEKYVHEELYEKWDLTIENILYELELYFVQSEN